LGEQCGVRIAVRSGKNVRGNSNRPRTFWSGVGRLPGPLLGVAACLGRRASMAVAWMRTSAFAVQQGTGSFATGAGSFNPITHEVPFFTPVAQLVRVLAVHSPIGSWKLGQHGFDSFHGPRVFYADATLMKNFSITERVKAQFRMDAFNVFNHQCWALPQTRLDRCLYRLFWKWPDHGHRARCLPRFRDRYASTRIALRFNF